MEKKYVTHSLFGGEIVNLNDADAIFSVMTTFAAVRFAALGYGLTEIRLGSIAVFNILATDIDNGRVELFFRSNLNGGETITIIVILDVVD